jgi:rare lipoprotein A
MNLALKKRNLHFLMFFLACLFGFSASAMQEYGTASVYSSRFQGSRTANGEVFNHNQYTASHRTLPFGSLIKITRTDNGKAVIVRINDRGPFVNERITDLSKAAASKLNISGENDEIRVKIEVVTDKKAPLGSISSDNSFRPAVLASDRPINVPMPESFESVTSKGLEFNNIPREYHKKSRTIKSTPTVTVKSPASTIPSMKAIPKEYSKTGVYAVKGTNKPTVRFAIQVASLNNHANMEKKVADLQGKYFDNVLVNIVNVKNSTPIYKILLGPFQNEAAAKVYLQNMRKKNMNGFIVNIK